MAHKSAFAKGNFVCFDGEGINIDGRHEYTYMAAYDGKIFRELSNWQGLKTEQCLRFLLGSAQFEGIHVIYGGSYDANMMLRTLDKASLAELHANGRTKWRTWWIDYVPRKYFGVQGNGKTIRLWDVIGFFQGSFVKTLKLWLDVEDAVIAKGKAQRSTFRLDQATEIEHYCRQELRQFYDLMRRFWEAVRSITLTLNRWDGAGAGASALYRRYGMRSAIGGWEQQEKHYDKAQLAYAGGTFQLLRPGDYQECVHEYDINSAYPHFMRQLPPFVPLRSRVRGGRFSCGCSAAQVRAYDLVHYRYRSNETQRLHPFVHRDQAGNITKPSMVDGWCWAPEYYAGLHYGAVEVVQVMHWHDDGTRPFRWIETEYRHRLWLQALGTRAQHSLKLFLNSLYGKLAQQKGWKASKPLQSIPWTHNLYMAGWITSSTRALLQTTMAKDPNAIIACETDAVFSTRPLDLPLGIELGQWKQTVFPHGLSYLQSGMYFGENENGVEIERYRGVDQYNENGEKILTRLKILQAWERMSKSKKARNTLPVTCTRFRTIGTSLAGDERLATWRQWIREPKAISLIPQSKRVHIPLLCAMDRGARPPCKWGPGLHHLTYPSSPTDGDIVSKPYAVLWVTGPKKVALMASRDEQDEYGLWEE